MNQTEFAGRQAANAAANRAQAAVAEARRDASIVQQASRLFASALSEEKRPKRAKSRRLNGIYLAKEAVRAAPDGYVRRSPVQPTRVAKDYAARIAAKVAIAVVVAAVAIAGLYLLFDVLKII